MTNPKDLWLVLLLLIPVLVVGTEDPQMCKQMRGKCRLVTQQLKLDEGVITRLNVSCFCKHQEDILQNLRDLLSVKCSWLPSEPYLKVNFSTIHLTGCSVKSNTFPTELLRWVRRTDNLEIMVSDSPKLRLERITAMENVVPNITASFINSNLSGLPEGWVTGGRHVVLRMEGSEVPVIESRALAAYPEDAEVYATFINTDIHKIMMVAFDLPKTSVVRFERGSIMDWNRSGFSGGTELHLLGVRLWKVLPKAINIAGLRNYSMSNCIVANLYDNALNMGITDERQQVEDSSASLTNNIITEANGEALSHLCYFRNISFHNNTFVNLTNPPLKLQFPGCQPARDWNDAVSNTQLGCTNCEDFREADEQVCGVYRSAYCISCSQPMDQCYKPLLPYLVFNKCKDSHPSVVQSLQNACGSGDQAMAPQARSFDSAAPLTSSGTLAMVVGMLLTLLLGGKF